MSRALLARLRPQIFDRDGNVCVVNAADCVGSLTLQHRVPRGMGGSKLLDKPENLVAMCAYHNQLDQADAVFHARCVDAGHSAPRWVDARLGVENIPVKYWDGWYMLDGLRRVAVADDLAIQLIKRIYE